jgi:hypothetical protein
MRLLTFIAAFVALAVSASAQENVPSNVTEGDPFDFDNLNVVSCNFFTLGRPSDWTLKLIGCCRLYPTRSSYMIDITTNGCYQRYNRLDIIAH